MNKYFFPLFIIYIYTHRYVIFLQCYNLRVWPVLYLPSHFTLWNIFCDSGMMLASRCFSLAVKIDLIRFAKYVSNFSRIIEFTFSFDSHLTECCLSQRKLDRLERCLNPHLLFSRCQLFHGCPLPCWGTSWKACHTCTWANDFWRISCPPPNCWNCETRLQ